LKKIHIHQSSSFTFKLIFWGGRRARELRACPGCGKNGKWKLARKMTSFRFPENGFVL